MTRTGRPRTGTPVLVRIPPDLLERVDLWADRAGVTRAEAVRRLLDAGLVEAWRGVVVAAGEGGPQPATDDNVARRIRPQRGG